MSPKDAQALASWIRSGASLAQVESVSEHGLVGNQRFTPDAKRAFRMLWSWAAPRFSGSIGAKQDHIYNKCGAEFLARRIARAQRIALRLAQS